MNKNVERLYNGIIKENPTFVPATIKSTLKNFFISLSFYYSILQK